LLHHQLRVVQDVLDFLTLSRFHLDEFVALVGTIARFLHLEVLEGSGQQVVIVRFWDDSVLVLSRLNRVSRGKVLRGAHQGRGNAIFAVKTSKAGCKT